MGGGNNAYQRSLQEQMNQQMANQAADRAYAREPSEVEKAKNKRYLDVQAWKKKKDYRSPAPGMVDLNFADPAQRRRMRERQVNAMPTGMAALGAEGNPTALAQTNAWMKDVNDRDAAESYEGDLRAYDAFVEGDSNALMANDMARKGLLLGNSTQSAQAYANMYGQYRPQSILPGLLSAGIGAAGMFLGGPAGAGIGSAIGGMFGGAASGSDVEMKQDFEDVNPDEILDKVVTLPISQWSYKYEGKIRHIGPMAQDFQAAFQVGDNEKVIYHVDMNGVALAAIQGLNAKVQSLEAQVKSLLERLDAK